LCQGRSFRVVGDFKSFNDVPINAMVICLRDWCSILSVTRPPRAQFKFGETMFAAPPRTLRREDGVDEKEQAQSGVPFGGRRPNVTSKYEIAKWLLKSKQIYPIPAFVNFLKQDAAYETDAELHLLIDKLNKRFNGLVR
jgi:hypothetical protein